ncbi:type II toxin-antitoxin system RelE/ParE family toxin [candidate division KSB1 bacterium]|nr:type II toxin-antitoxin system RelE/ParE family toxin [candidate division KSB1 bacterium]
MKYKLVVRKEAENDLTSASQWYENQRKGLGHDFLLCVDAKINTIIDNPRMYQNIYKNVKRALIRKFPYGIFYLIDRNSIVILAILHCRRSTLILEKRL